MPVKTTSRLAFAVLKGDTQTNVIFKALKKARKGVTRQELAANTGLPINAVCGRVAELIADGKAQVLTLRRGESGRLCEVVGVSA